MFSLDDVRLRASDERALLRAKAIADAIDPASLDWTSDPVSCAVPSSEGTPYTVQVSSELSASCTCTAFRRSGRRMFCKHVGALAMLWLRQRKVIIDENSLDSDLANALARLTDAECRLLLCEAAGASAAVRDLILGKK